MACSPQSSTDKSERVISDATDHFIAGKRYLLVKDYVAAVTSLQEACELIAKQYGQTATECAEPYLYYGEALLELSRIETGVLGNALEGVNPEDEEDADSSEDDQVENPDKVSREEREQIIQQVEAAIDENSRDLEEIMARKTNGVVSENAQGTKNFENLKMDGSETTGSSKSDPKEKLSESETLGESNSQETLSKLPKAPEDQTVMADNASKVTETADKNPSVLVTEKSESSSKVVLEEKANLSSDSSENNETKQSLACSTESHVGDNEVSNEKSSPSNLNAQDETKGDSDKMDDNEELDEGIEANEEENALGEDELEEDGGDESTGEKSQDEEVGQMDDGAGPSTSTGISKEEKEEEVTNLQLAWEILELSKVIFKRQCESDKAKELKVADVLLKLGEVSIESENYPQAIEDLTECFSIQKKHLASHDRALAETLYQLGLATSFSDQFERAIENFTSSMNVVEERIAILKQSLEDQEKSGKTVTANGTDATVQSDSKSDVKEVSQVEKCTESGTATGEEAKNENTLSSDDAPEDPCLSIRQEIEELEKLIPDIRTKVEDTEDMMKNALLSTKEALSLSENSDPVPFKSEEKAKPISNISHLVKKKET